MTKRETPALRFGKYSQPWVEAKNNRIFAPTDERGFAGLPVLSATQKDGFIPRSMLGKEISYNKDAEKTYKRVLPDDFAIHLRSFQGGFAHSKYEGITSPAYTTFRLRQVSQHNGLFWKYLFTSPSFIQSLTKVTYGIRDGRSIGADEYFLEDSCFPPSLEEQRAIGELFADLDALIEQHRAKHANLQQTKTALLQRMFPQDGADEPELRLGGFSGAWGASELQHLADKFTDGDWIESKNQSSSGIRLLQTGNVAVSQFLAKPGNEKWISESTFQRLRCEEVLPGDILISRLPEPAGRACIVPALSYKMITAVDCTIMRTNSSSNPDFVLAYLSTVEYFDSIRLLLAGGTRQRVSRSNLATIRIPTPPTLEEQRAIGEVFSNLDALIAAEHRYITQLTQAKTALLQRMFV